MITKELLYKYIQSPDYQNPSINVGGKFAIVKFKIVDMGENGNVNEFILVSTDKYPFSIELSTYNTWLSTIRNDKINSLYV